MSTIPPSDASGAESLRAGIDAAMGDVREASVAMAKLANENAGNTDDPLANLKTLQAQMHYTQTLNFAQSLMTSNHQLCMKSIEGLGQAGR